MTALGGNLTGISINRSEQKSQRVIINGKVYSQTSRQMLYLDGKTVLRERNEEIFVLLAPPTMSWLSSQRGHSCTEVCSADVSQWKRALRCIYQFAVSEIIVPPPTPAPGITSELVNPGQNLVVVGEW